MSLRSGGASLGTNLLGVLARNNAGYRKLPRQTFSGLAGNQGPATLPEPRLPRMVADFHVLVLSERHLRRIITRYFAYYHRARTHLALDKDAPDRRPIARPELGRVIQIPEVGGLHHRYVRRAA
jgi:hypothetical protein